MTYLVEVSFMSDARVNIWMVSVDLGEMLDLSLRCALDRLLSELHGFVPLGAAPYH